MTSIEAKSEQDSGIGDRPHHSQLVRRVTGTALLLSLVAVEPVVAQESAVCAAERLPEMISGFFQFTTGIGVIGVVVVWQADSLAEMFTLHPEQREGLKRHKRGALKSALLLLVLGPLYVVAGTMMNLPLAQCIDLVPW